jgi:hypothetical protein
VAEVGPEGDMKHRFGKAFESLTHRTPLYPKGCCLGINWIRSTVLARRTVHMLIFHRLGTSRPSPALWTRVGQDIHRLEYLGRDARFKLKPELISAVEELPNTRPRVRVIQRILRLEYLNRLAKIKLKSELISLVEGPLGYRFKDENKCLEALAVEFKYGSLRTVNNKRLALVGDAYLRLELLMAWYPSGQSTGKSKYSSQIEYVLISNRSRGPNVVCTCEQCSLNGPGAENRT